MGRTRTWTVEIRIIEHEDEGGTPSGVTVRWQPPDQEVSELGDVRALADLAYKALDVAAGDLGSFTRHSLRMMS